MKRYKVLLGLVLLSFLFLGLAYSQQEEKGQEMAQEQLTPELYAQKMADIAATIGTVIDSKFVFADKEVNFVSKKVNAFGHTSAIGFYQGLKQVLEDAKRDLLLINPSPQYAENYKLFKEGLDYFIAAYGKAVEAHEKDDITIMDEGGALLRKGGEVMLEANQSFEKSKTAK
jgi:hypothetical protein